MRERGREEGRARAASSSPSFSSSPLINHGAPFRNLSFIIRPPDMQKARKDQLVAPELARSLARSLLRQFLRPFAHSPRRPLSSLPPPTPAQHWIPWHCNCRRAANSGAPGEISLIIIGRGSDSALHNSQSQALARNFRRRRRFLPAARRLLLLARWTGRHRRRRRRRNDKWSPLLVSNEAADEMGGRGRCGRQGARVGDRVYGSHADTGAHGKLEDLGSSESSRRRE